MTQKIDETALDRAEELGAKHAEEDVLYDLGLVLDEDGCPMPRPFRARIAWSLPFYRAVYEAAYELTYQAAREERAN